jgi:adenylate cyclase
MQANSVFWRMTRADVDATIAILRKTVQRYPDYAPAQSMLAFALLFRAIATGAFRGQDLPDAVALASRAAELDDSDPWAHLALGWAALLRRRTEIALEQYQRALDINPNFAAAHGHLGMAYALDDQSDKAVVHMEQAIRMSPHDPQTFLFNTNLAIAHYLSGRYAEAVVLGRKAVQQRPAFTPGLRIYSASLAQAGQIDEARAALDQLKGLQPETSIAWIEENLPYKPQAMAKLVAGLRKAGLE